MSCERIFEPTCLIHDPVGSSRGPCTRLALDVDENKKGFLNIKLKEHYVTEHIIYFKEILLTIVLYVMLNVS